MGLNKMIKTFVDVEKITSMLKDGGTLEASYEMPYRAFDLVEFYKLIKDKHNIIGFSIDPESNNVSFLIGDVE
jgi:hypothetical protein